MLNKHHQKLAMALLLSLALISVCSAQVATADKQSSETQSLHTDIKLPMPTACVFSGTFEQTKSLKGLDNDLKTSGVFFYHCHYGVIWKTTSPIYESLVLSSTDQSYKVDSVETTKLKSKQSRLLNLLINGLIGADNGFITKYFNLSQSNAINNYAYEPEGKVKPAALNYRLLPKKRPLKRAIEHIELSISRDSTLTAHPHSDTQEIIIEILDRNQQLTHITALKKQKYTQQDTFQTQCSPLLTLKVNNINSQNNSVITAAECQLLHAPPIK